LRLSLIVLALLSFVTPAGAEGLYCVALKAIPKLFRAEPTVPYTAYTISSDLLNTRYCADPDAGEVVGCTYTLDDGKSWIIVIADTVSAEDHACVLAYEKAHLPPNCWGDPGAEKPDAMALLNRLQRRSCGARTRPIPAARSLPPR